jgi:hypothetical protein
MGRTIAGLFGLLALAGATFASAACATSNGDADVSPGEGGGEQSSSGNSSSGSTDRPAFDASFEPTDPADANVDPTEAGGDTCVDNDDPGSSETGAKQLPSTDDCDDDFKTVKGVLNGAVDVDFYKLSMTDKFGLGCTTSQKEFSAATSGAEICVYARCKNATANAVSGCKDGTEDASIVGMKGCCTSGPGKATPEWDCEGLSDNDSADFVIRIKQAAGGDKCLPYSFSYRF